MSERYDVAVRVVSQKGTCNAKHKVGDEWVIERRTPGGMCLSALNALYPHLRVLMFGGVFPWAADPDATRVICPDIENPVIFELRRIRK